MRSPIRRTTAALLAVLALVVGLLAGTTAASALTPNDKACRAGITLPYDQGEAVAYNACRFDKLEDLVKAGQTPTSSPSPTPSVTPSTSATPTTSPTKTPTPTPTPSSTPTSSAALCTNPSVTFTGEGSKGVGNGYDISAEQWGVSGYNYQSTLRFCSKDSWNVDITTDNAKGDGAVKSYPSIRKIYHDWSTSDFSKDPRLSSFPQLKVDYAHVSPSSCSGCIYEEAFDIWLNGIGGSNNTELMIWTHNVGQRPYGSKVGSVTVDGQAWDLWSGNSNHYVAFVPANGASLPSGTVDVKAFVQYLIDSGRMASSAYDGQGGKTDPFVGQISYGVEPVSTGGVSKHWDFTRFAITES